MPKPTQTVFLLDTSSSMASYFSDMQTDVAFLSSLMIGNVGNATWQPTQANQLAIIQFNSDAIPITTGVNGDLQLLTLDAAAEATVYSDLTKLTASNNAPINSVVSDAYNMGIQVLTGDDSVNKCFVLFSNGNWPSSVTLPSTSIPVHVVSFGNDATGLSNLKGITSSTYGTYFSNKETDDYMSMLYSIMVSTLDSFQQWGRGLIRLGEQNGIRWGTGKFSPINTTTESFSGWNLGSGGQYTASGSQGNIAFYSYIYQNWPNGTNDAAYWKQTPNRHAKFAILYTAPGSQTYLGYKGFKTLADIPEDVSELTFSDGVPVWSGGQNGAIIGVKNLVDSTNYKGMLLFRQGSEEKGFYYGLLDFNQGILDGNQWFLTSITFNWWVGDIGVTNFSNLPEISDES